MTNDVLQRIEDYFLGRRHESMLAPDAVIEDPFARRRYESAAEFEEATREERASLPVRFETFRYTAVHETTDPEVTIVEYELGGTVLTTGRKASAPFIAVMRVRDGQIILWREYQDKAAIAEALS
jgi:ketosteroid isomerase-like protein